MILGHGQTAKRKVAGNSAALTVFVMVWPLGVVLVPDHSCSTRLPSVLFPAYEAVAIHAQYEGMEPPRGASVHVS